MKGIHTYCWVKPLRPEEDDHTGLGVAGMANACGAADGIELALRANGRLCRHGSDVGGDHPHAEQRGRGVVCGAVSCELADEVHAVLIWDGAGFLTDEDTVVPAM